MLSMGCGKGEEYEEKFELQAYMIAFELPLESRS